MMTAILNIEQKDVTKLLSAASPDAALLYLYLHSRNPLERAVQDLHMSESRVSCAAATLRQLGLWQTEEKRFITGERPDYSQQDVISAMAGKLGRIPGVNIKTAYSNITGEG